MFVAREYATGANGVQLDGSVVWLVDVYLDDHEKLQSWLHCLGNCISCHQNKHYIEH